MSHTTYDTHQHARPYIYAHCNITTGFSLLLAKRVLIHSFRCTRMWYALEILGARIIIFEYNLLIIDNTVVCTHFHFDFRYTSTWCRTDVLTLDMVPHGCTHFRYLVHGCTRTWDAWCTDNCTHLRYLVHGKLYSLEIPGTQMYSLKIPGTRMYYV